MKTLLLLFIFFGTNCLAARNPPKWKFTYHFGQATTHYLEEQPSIIFTTKNLKQKSAIQEFHWTYFLFPPFIDINLSTQITGLQYEEPEEEADRFEYINSHANIGIHVPISDFVQFRFVFEYIYTSMIVKNNDFGFQDLHGYQVYPEIELLPFGSTMFAQITPYFKTSIWSNLYNRRETTFGIKWKIPFFAPQEQTFPTYAYQRSIILKLFYTNMHLTFEREGFIPSEMDVRQVGGTIGFSF